DLKSLGPIVQEILGEINPALELPRSERWLASISGKQRSYSAEIRKGLASTLAHLSVHASPNDLGNGSTYADWVSIQVQQLLDAADADATGRRWESLTDQLPILAEAAPDVYLNAVSNGRSGNPPLLGRVFQDTESDGLFAHQPPHWNLLLALEALAWSPD